MSIPLNFYLTEEQSANSRRQSDGRRNFVYHYISVCVWFVNIRYIKLIAKIRHFSRVNAMIVYLVVMSIAGIVNGISNMEAKVTAVESLLRHFHKELKIPGMAVGIVTNRETILLEGFGLRDHQDSQSHVTTRTLFGIASCTKSFTTYALDRLVNVDGALGWNDLVISRISEFRLKDVFTMNRIQVKDLVTHVSGLPNHDFVAYHSNITRTELLARVAHLEANYDLREKFQYNNIMFAIAGTVIERTTGRPWEEIVRSRIFEPLNMTRSFPSIRDVGRLQNGRIDGDDDIVTPHQLSVNSEGDQIISSVPWLDLTNVGPSASIVSCVEDMAKWIRAQLALSGRSKEIHNAQVVIPSGDVSDNLDGGEAYAYGLGWVLSWHRGQRIAWHSGQIDGLYSRIVLFPAENLGIVVLSNLQRPALGRVVHNLILRIAEILRTTYHPPSKPPTESDHMKWISEQRVKFLDTSKWNSPANKEKKRPAVDRPEQYVGVFENPGYGIVEIDFVESRLVASHHNLRYVLESLRGADFFSAQCPQGFTFECSFARDSFGDVSGYRFNLESRVSPILFEKKVEKVATDLLSTAVYLRSFVGVFENADSCVQFRVNDDEKPSLMVTSSVGKSQYAGEVTPRKRNWFRLERTLFEFVVSDSDGVVRELNVHEEDFVSVLKRKN